MIILHAKRMRMKTLQVRNLPDELYEALVEAAKQEHRSLAQQTIALLERALNLYPSNRERRKLVVARLKKRGTDLKIPIDPVTLVREDRNR